MQETTTESSNAPLSNQTVWAEEKPAQAAVAGTTGKIDKYTTIPTSKGNVAAQASVLENLQAEFDRREAARQGFGGFMENLKDAQAWWSGGLAGPGEALSKRAEERRAQEASRFNMLNEIAMAKAANEQARATKAYLTGQGAGGTGAPGATGTQQPGVRTVGGVAIPDQIQAKINFLVNSGRIAEAEALEKEFLKTYTGRQIEQEFSAEWAKPIDYMRQMPDGSWQLDKAPLREAYQYSLANPRHPTNRNIVGIGNTITNQTPAQSADVPVSVRNNNPGNLVDPKTGKFRVFDTPEEGEAALDADVEAKLSNNSPAYKSRFGNASVTPSRLAETWSPAAATGNSAASTNNYSAAIAKELGIGMNDNIPNTPEAIEAVKRAITRFEAGTGSGNVNAPVAPAAPAPVRTERPSYSSVEATTAAQKEGATKYSSKMGESAAATAEAINKAGVEAGQDYVRATDIVNIASSKDMQDMFGVLQKGGVAPAVLRQLENAINAGQFGTIGLKNLSDNLAKAKATPDQIAKYDRMIRNLAQVELKWSSTYLKGQGAVSDNERELVRKAIGEAAKDPAKALVLQGKIMQERAGFDAAMSKAFNLYKEKNGSYADFDTFMRNQGSAIIAKHNKDLSELLGVDFSGSNPYKTGATTSTANPAETTPNKGVTKDERSSWKERYGKKG